MLNRIRLWIAVAMLMALAGAVCAEPLEITSRQVSLTGNIDMSRVDASVSKLLEFDQRSQDPIFMRINSPGGSVEAGYVLIDVMRALRSPVHCLIESRAHSMAAILTAYCKHVYVLPHATMMFHEASYGTLGEDPTIRSKVEFNTRYLQRIYEEVAEQLGMDIEEYRKRIRDGWWMMADEAVRLGAADSVVSHLSYREIFVEEFEIKRTVRTVHRREPGYELNVQRDAPLPGQTRAETFDAGHGAELRLESTPSK